MVVPRRYPGFPGNRLKLFVAVCALLFAAQIGAVLWVTGTQEVEEGAAAENPPTATTPASTTPTTTTPAAAAGRRDGRQEGLSLGGLHRLSHAQGRRGDGHGRPEPRRREAAVRARDRPGHARQGRDAVVLRETERDADPGRREVRLDDGRHLGASRRPGSSWGNHGSPTRTEREGFEPSTHLSARTRFPVALLRPLGHLSRLRPSLEAEQPGEPRQGAR